MTFKPSTTVNPALVARIQVHSPDISSETVPERIRVDLVTPDGRFIEQGMGVLHAEWAEDGALKVYVIK